MPGFHSQPARGRLPLGRTLLPLTALWLLAASCGGNSAGPQVISRIDVAPSSPVILYPAAVQLTAMARDAGGSEISGVSFTWSSDDATIASVSGTGLLQPQHQGTTTVRARAAGVEGTATVTVEVPIGQVQIGPGDTTVSAYDSLAYRLDAIDLSGDTVAAPAAAWSSSDTTLAVVDAKGLVITRATGTVIIGATAGNSTGTTLLHIQPPRVASVEIRAPNTGRPTQMIPLRATEKYIAIPYDAKGLPLSGRVTAWQVSDSSVLSVDTVPAVSNGGIVGALAPGQAVLTATADGVPSAGLTINVLVLPTMTGLAVGDFRSCAISMTGDAYCWGANGYGELGDSTTTFRDGPVLVAGGHQWAKLTSGDLHTCGLTTTGAAYCWGSNASGELGTGTTTESHVPVPVSGGLTFQDISAGSAYTCGVTTVHQAYCWGANGLGQLGTGGTAGASVPTPAQGGLSVQSISTSRIYLSVAIVTCVVTTTAEGYCWGSNADGQLGTGDSASATSPRLVAGSIGWASISASTFHACGTDSLGTAYCWGANPYGNLGNGTLTSDPLPTPVSGGPYRVVSTGYFFGCAVQQSSDLACFGTNTSHQLGIVGQSQVLSPANPAPGTLFQAVGAGRSHTCALDDKGVVWCWGSNAAGESGADSAITVATPQKIVGEP